MEDTCETEFKGMVYFEMARDAKFFLLIFQDLTVLNVLANFRIILSI